MAHLRIIKQSVTFSARSCRHPRPPVLPSDVFLLRHLAWRRLTQAQPSPSPAVGKNNRRSRFSTVSIVSSRVPKVRPRKAYWKPGKGAPASKSHHHTRRGAMGAQLCVLKPQRVNATALRQWVDGWMAGPAGVSSVGVIGPDRPSAPARKQASPFSSFLCPHRNLVRSMMPVVATMLLNGGKRRQTIIPQGAHARYILETRASTRQSDMGASVSPPPQESGRRVLRGESNHVYF